MTSFVLKIIGIICMFLDHFGDAIIGCFSNLNLIGRIAFPIFAYQSVQGYLYTKDIKKHLFKLFVFAFIAQLPFMLFLSTFSKSFYLNVFFTFFLGLLTLFLYDKCKNKVLGCFVVLLGSIIGEILRVDYGAFGILLIYIFYFFEHDFNALFKNKKILPYKKLFMSIVVIIACFSKYIFQIIKSPNFLVHYLLCGFFTSLSLLFILLYNKKEGRKLKYFFYIFYPSHLLILYFLHIFL